MLSVVDRLGTLDNLAMILVDAHRRVVVVEDESDERLLGFWLERVLGADFPAMQRRLVFLRAHRRPTGDTVNQMLNAITDAFRVKDANFSFTACVIADRDYQLDATLGLDQA